ncbi:MAG: hypothetical protein AB1657_00005, partial [Candidatus Micrarchaeota archaeon]
GRGEDAGADGDSDVADPGADGEAVEEADAETPGEDAGDAEAEATETADADADAGCSPSTIYEWIENPMPDFGGSRQMEVLRYETTEWAGSECETTSTGRTLAGIDYTFTPPIETSAESLRNVVGQGAITPLFDPDQKVLSFDIAGGCLETAKIVAGDVLSPSNRVLAAGIYIISFVFAAGEDRGGTIVEWVDYEILDRDYNLVGNPRVDEAVLFPVPDGRKLMPTGVDTAVPSARTDVLEAAGGRICDGEGRTRTTDGLPFVFHMDVHTDPADSAEKLWKLSLNPP